MLMMNPGQLSLPLTSIVLLFTFYKPVLTAQHDPQWRGQNTKSTNDCIRRRLTKMMNGSSR